MGGFGKAAVVACALVMSATTAQAAGFEKSIMWSGRYGGLAGATTGYVDGSQSLAFNPAGLARPEGYIVGWSDTKWGPEVSLNFSPTGARFKGPVTSPAETESEWTFSPVFGATASFRPLERLGIGVGGFVTGGTRSLFKDVDFSGFNPNFDTLKPDISAELNILELSVGAGYELFDGLRVGAAYRIAFANAHLQSAVPVPAPAGAPAGTPPVALVSVDLDELSGQSFDGARVGVQYAPREGFAGLGVHWRSPVDFTAKGRATGKMEAGVGPNGPAGDLGGSDARVSAQLPSQIVAGGFISPTPGRSLRLFAEYSFSHYEVIRALAVDATLTGPTGDISVPDIATDWHNQHQMRVAAEWLPLRTLALRAGYGLTGQVTRSSLSRPTLASPGLGHSVTAGAGTALLGGFLQLNAAFEASFASGDGTNEYGLEGRFSSLGLVGHLGATMTF